MEKDEQGDKEEDREQEKDRAAQPSEFNLRESLDRMKIM